jgi:lysophospholipase L1-like esterase
MQRSTPLTWVRPFLWATIALLLSAGPSPAQTPADKKPEEKAKPAAKPADRWEAAIARFEALDKQKPPPKDGILFVGSSSIVGWNVEKSFPGLPVINRGFGGSQIADSVRYADRIVLPHQPKIVVFYAGDNDLASGKNPQQLLADYRAFVKKIHDALPKTRIVYIAVKPSIARWKLVEKVREANALIRAAAEKDPRLVFIDVDKPMIGADGKPRGELFKPDGLHLNADGYKLWNELVGPHLK